MLDPQTGFVPTVWNSWVDNWTGQEIIQPLQIQALQLNRHNGCGDSPGQGGNKREI
jgi:hypothetical protein